jgi:hypothetical protein
MVRFLAALSAGSKQLGCEADHSLQSSTKVKNGWNYTVFTQYALMACTWTTLLVSSYILAVHTSLHTV